MTLVADLAAAASGAAAVVALALAFLAVRAYRTTGSQRSMWLAFAFIVAASQAIVMALLLVRTAELASAWLIVPLAHLAVLTFMYVALLRV